ncbi:aldo/keto reductase [bacterium AH-315-M05]|nr:aldo/keto reductase [bacterium AH-315-M05]
MDRLVLGTAQLGLKYGINNKKRILEDEVFQILKEALNNGIYFFDTACTYGNSEKLLGKIFKANTEVKIISKLPKCRPEEVEKIVNASMNKLKTKKLYGYLIHDFSNFIANPEIWNKLIDLKRKDLVGKIGFSIYFPQELEFLLEKDIQFDIIQFPYSVFDQRFSAYFPILHEKNIETHVRSVFLQGIVAKKPTEVDDFFSKIKPKLEILQAFSRNINMSVTGICLNFVMSNSYISKAIIGVDNKENLKQNIESLQDIHKIKNIYEELINLSETDESIILPLNWG